MDAILQAFEEQLTSAALAAVQGVVASAKGEVARLLEAAHKEREAGVREVEQKRAELALEVVAMHKVAVVVCGGGGVCVCVCVCAHAHARVWVDGGVVSSPGGARRHPCVLSCVGEALG